MCLWLWKVHASTLKKKQHSFCLLWGPDRFFSQVMDTVVCVVCPAVDVCVWPCYRFTIMIKSGTLGKCVCMSVLVGLVGRGPSFTALCCDYFVYFYPALGCNWGLCKLLVGVFYTLLFFPILGNRFLLFSLSLLFPSLSLSCCYSDVPTLHINRVH